MARTDHYRTAEGHLTEAMTRRRGRKANRWFQSAQVHATLALTDAILALVDQQKKSSPSAQEQGEEQN